MPLTIIEIANKGQRESDYQRGREKSIVRPIFLQNITGKVLYIVLYSCRLNMI